VKQKPISKIAVLGSLLKLPFKHDNLAALSSFHQLTSKHKQMTARIVFSSDLHGNLGQYQKIIKLARKQKANAIIVGGDLFPKSSSVFGVNTKTVDAQKKYFTEQIIPIVKEFEGHVYFSFGNADFISNVRFYREYLSQQKEKLSHIHVVDNDTVEIPSTNIRIFAYGGVPWTRHKLKDWERFDTSTPDHHDTKDLAYLTTHGAVSYADTDFAELIGLADIPLTQFILAEKEKEIVDKYGEGVRHACFPTFENVNVMSNYSIEAQLRRALLKNNITPENNKHMIWVIHGPPYNSNLDVLKTNTHCGSVAVRNLIEEYKPLLSFHGHIHETVDMSGHFMSKIGDTISLSAGNYPSKKKLSAIVVDTNIPENAVRIVK
jgi:Icc-related predicted phosphoesterase